MTQDELQTILQQIANEAVNIFNAEYDTNVDVTSSVFQDFLEAFTIVSLFGWQSLVQRNYESRTLKLVQKILGKDYATYKGANNTTQERLESLIEAEGEVDNSQLQQFFEDRVQEVLFGAGLAVMQTARFISAQESGLNKYVGGFTMRDSKVRDKHRRHEKKYWKVGTYEPWFDYGDRCSYIWFSTEQDAINAGFTKL